MTASSNARIRVLGVDPGSRKTGWGIVDIEMQSRKVLHVDNGVLMLEAAAPLTTRLVDLSKRLQAVVETHRPDIAAVEDVFVDKSARSALTLGQARGAVLATLGLCGLSVESHMASQVKRRVTGRGRASKTQVNEMVGQVLGLPEQPFEDAADALAVALCQGLEALSPLASVVIPTPVRTQKRGRAGLEQLARAQGKVR